MFFTKLARLQTYFAPLLLLAAAPVLAAPSIAVVPEAALNGTNEGLKVTFDGLSGQAVVISSHPQNERTFNVSFFINPNNVSMTSGTNARLWVFRGQGNRLGTIQETHRIGLKRTPSGLYRAIVWVRNFDSANPGFWDDAGGFFFNSGTTPAKITVEWVAADDGMSNGSIRVLKDDVQVSSLTGLATTLEVDNARMGHVAGASASGALGSLFLDEYVSTR